MNTDHIIPRLEGKSFAQKFLFLLFIIAICFLISILLGAVLAIPIFGLDSVLKINQPDFLSDPKGTGLLKFFQAINQIGIFVVPAFIFGYLVNRRSLRYLQLDRRFSFSILALSLILIIVSIPLINLLVEFNEQMQLPRFLSNVEKWMRNAEDQAKLLTEVFLKVDTVTGLLVNLFIVAFLASLGEELLFRGVILRLFRELFGNIHLAVILSAVLFSALHMQFYGFLPRTLLGILFGYLFIWSGSLWIPIILHFVFNGISVVAAYLYETGSIQTDFESFGSNQDSLVVAGSFILSSGLIYFLFRLRKKEPIPQQPA
jgi:uncharacterized protein